MKRIALVLFSLLYVFFLVSCFNLRSPDIEGIKKFNITKVTKNAIHFDIGVKINNPNNLNFKVTSINMDIYVNDQLIGDAKLKDKLTINKNKSDIYNFQVEAKLNKVLGGSIAGIIGIFLNQNIKINTKGELTVRSFLIKKTYKIEHEQRISAKDIPLF